MADISFEYGLCLLPSSSPAQDMKLIGDIKHQRIMTIGKTNTREMDCHKSKDNLTVPQDKLSVSSINEFKDISLNSSTYQISCKKGPK